MGVIAHSAPNYDAAFKSLGVPQGPVVTHTFTHLPLYSKVRGAMSLWRLSAFISWFQINGVMSMVTAYGGALIFP